MHFTIDREKRKSFDNKHYNSHYTSNSYVKNRVVNDVVCWRRLLPVDEEIFQGNPCLVKTEFSFSVNKMSVWHDSNHYNDNLNDVNADGLLRIPSFEHWYILKRKVHYSDSAIASKMLKANMQKMHLDGANSKK